MVIIISGLLCCQGLEELNVAFNSIALIAEVKKLASLSNLVNLSVAGNFYFRINYITIDCVPEYFEQ